MSLERTPAAEILPGTVQAWLEVLTDRREWNEERDAPRVREAFRTMARIRRTWPAPVDFTEAMPQPQEWTSLPKATPTPEHAAAVISEIKSRLGITETDGKSAAGGPDA